MSGPMSYGHLGGPVPRVYAFSYGPAVQPEGYSGWGDGGAALFLRRSFLDVNKHHRLAALVEARRRAVAHGHHHKAEHLAKQIARLRGHHDFGDFGAGTTDENAAMAMILNRMNAEGTSTKDGDGLDWDPVKAKKSGKGFSLVKKGASAGASAVGKGIFKKLLGKGAAAAGAGVTTAGGAAGGGGALASVGGALASVPVAGWIAAGGVAAAAGVFALVKGIRRGKLKRQAAVREAKRLGIPDAAKVPAFTAKAIKLGKKNPEKLARIGKKLERKVKHKHKGKKIAKLRAKLSILGAVLKLHLDQKKGHEPPPVSDHELESEHAAGVPDVDVNDGDGFHGGLPSWAPVAIGATVLGLVALVALKN